MPVSMAQEWKCSPPLLSCYNETSQCRWFCRAALAASLPLALLTACRKGKNASQGVFPTCTYSLRLGSQLRGLFQECDAFFWERLLTGLARVVVAYWRDSWSEAEAIIYIERRSLSKPNYWQLLCIKVKDPDVLKPCPQVIVIPSLAQNEGS